MSYTSIEICAGAGGQALGLEMAGFCHLALVEYEREYCDCLIYNRPEWNVECMDVHRFSGKSYQGTVDLLAGGVPCPPFSVAGKQLGSDDERDLFPQMLRLVEEIEPKIVMIENVRGFLDKRFENYRNSILFKLNYLGYNVHMKLINASDYGVPQLRPRAIIIGVSNNIDDTFSFPQPKLVENNDVGHAIYDLMAANGWKGVDEWRQKATKIAPTLVGGSKKHGGPDLGPTRARKAWAEMGIDGRGIANEPPSANYQGMPRLTPRMMARLQGFPDFWNFGDKKTSACRMIGNAFPPPVAKEIGLKIKQVLDNASTNSKGTAELSQKAVV